MPDPIGRGGRELAVERVRPEYSADSFLQIVMMPLADVLQVRVEVVGKCGGSHCPAVFVSFALADDDLVLLTTDVFDPQPQAIHQT